ncbi:FecR family protein [Butyricimonas faecalis]|uniref:FecR family protein n=1 Tax=Butyricimonas faecalis TaxID=2093856 RepID=A0A3Q9INI2_9BACT|nr:FecR family protein [Butyricimonas faecalis]AZS29655.1 FecR family protein [Butyricimonas faecalis]
MKMEKEIHELLLAYLRDDISEEEMIRLQGWLDENERHRKLLDELRDKEVLQQEIGAYASFDTSRRWIQLKEEMDKTSRKRRLLLRVWKSVAAVFVVAVAGGLLYWQITDSARPVEEQVLVAQIRPGETQAVLITGKGQQLLLQGLKDTCLDITGNETLKISKDGSLEYSLSALSRMPEWHTLQVPRGGEYKIVLDDGTEIWLNSASELKYPAHFVGNERRVCLVGEAYFQVARNEAAPFIVETRDMDVKVLGTSFNVSAYEDEENSHATLVEGRVEVDDKVNGEKVTLTPGEQALLQGKEMVVREVNTKLYSMWRLDRFTFASEDMEGVIRKLSRWYNVNFFFSNSSMKQKRFTGSLPKYSDISQVLKMIEMTTDIKFQVKGNTIIIQ